MESLFRLILLYSVFTALPVANSGNEEIDWESEVIHHFNSFNADYDAGKMDKLVRDNYVREFVRLSPNSIIQGDLQDLAKHFAARHELGYWEEGPLRIVSACGNTAVIWSELFFTEDNNPKKEGYLSIVLEYTKNRAKTKLLQVTV